MNGTELVKFHDLFDNDPIKFKIHGMFDFRGSTFQNKGGIDNVSDIYGPRDRVEFWFISAQRERKGKKKLINRVAMWDGEYCFKRTIPSPRLLSSLSTSDQSSLFALRPQIHRYQIYLSARVNKTNRPNIQPFVFRIFLETCQCLLHFPGTDWSGFSLRCVLRETTLGYRDAHVNLAGDDVILTGFSGVIKGQQSYIFLETLMFLFWYQRNLILLLSTWLTEQVVWICTVWWFQALVSSLSNITRFPFEPWDSTISYFMQIPPQKNYYQKWTF